MLRNLGPVDRIARLATALILAAIAWLNGGWAILWIVAAVLALTAALGSCPAYRLFGLSTCPLKRK